MVHTDTSPHSPSSAIVCAPSLVPARSNWSSIPQDLGSWRMLELTVGPSTGPSGGSASPTAAGMGDGGRNAGGDAASGSWLLLALAGLRVRSRRSRG